MNKSAKIAQDLASVNIDSARFYEHAMAEVQDPMLKPVFKRMADTKRRLINDLEQHILRSGEKPSGTGTFAGVMREKYTDIKAMLSREDKKVYVKELEEAEDRILEHYREALSEVESDELEHLLEAQLPTVNACHDEMRTLKRQLLS